MSHKIKNAVLIVAAGKGERFGGSLPKQYSKVAGKTVLRSTIEAFLNHPEIDHVQVIYNNDHHDLYNDATNGLELPTPVNGGNSRQESVLKGLEALENLNPVNVLIHDAARPLVSNEVISSTIKGLENFPGAVPAIAVADTMKFAANDAIEKTVDRSNHYLAQTPQGFDFETIYSCHKKYTNSDGFTDDASLLEAEGLQVKITKGCRENLKLTHPEDSELATKIILSRLNDIRTGSGFDVHRFDEEPAQSTRLCGINIPYSKKLAGHSDADVALHALTDALLASISLGDIGSHFPPSDPQWKNIDSSVFVEHAVAEIHKRSGMIAHADITLICEAPKIGPYREQMIERVAQLLQTEKSRVSVKATTTEKLGFTGRGEGIAAQATVTVRLPL